MLAMVTFCLSTGRSVCSFSLSDILPFQDFTILHSSAIELYSRSPDFDTELAADQARKVGTQIEALFTLKSASPPLSLEKSSALYGYFTQYYQQSLCLLTARLDVKRELPKYIAFCEHFAAAARKVKCSLHPQLISCLTESLFLYPEVRHGPLQIGNYCSAKSMRV
jgi:hypothetical protein